MISIVRRGKKIKPNRITTKQNHKQQTQKHKQIQQDADRLQSVKIKSKEMRFSRKQFSV